MYYLIYMSVGAVFGLLLGLRLLLSINSILFHLRRLWRLVDDATHSYQIYTVPELADNGTLNPLYTKARSFVNSLPSVEDSDNLARIFSSGRKSNDFIFQPGPAQPVPDTFRGARVYWSHHPGHLQLRLRRADRHRVLRPYLHHVESIVDDLDSRKKEVKLFTNYSSSCWRAIPFTHPATIDTVAMDPELKTLIVSDLESFLKAKNYYARLGRVWKRSYLLYGPPGTGKSTFVAAMAKFLGYDIFDLDLFKLTESGDLKSLLLRTSPKSVILVEDLDRYLNHENSKDKVNSMLNFMDGVFSCCGDERVMVFTMSGDSKNVVDPAVLRPGRLDVHIYFPLCDFSAFKTLAISYLGLKDHKLYPQVEEGFQNGAKISPAEVGEIMIANRGSPSRALKTVINALHQQRSASRRAMSENGSVNGGSGGDDVLLDGGGGGGTRLGFGKDATVREFKKLYGLIRRSGSKREGTMSVEMAAAVAAAANAAAVEAVAAGHGNGFEKDGL